jgi:hypothetical protein
LKEEQKTKEEVDAKAAVARTLQEEEEELERLIREMEDAEAKRLAKQAAEKAAANKFAADKRTYLDQLSGDGRQVRKALIRQQDPFQEVARRPPHTNSQA